MKKFVLFLFLILLFALGGLWYLGGAAPAATPDVVAEPPFTATDYFAEVNTPVVTYTSADITLAAPATTTLNVYIAELGQILTTHNEKLTEGPLLTFQRYLQTQNESDLAQLAGAARRHQETNQQLLALLVPAEMRVRHLELLNKMTHLAQVVFGMSQVKKDPVLALVNAQNYEKQYAEFIGAILNLNRSFLQTVASTTELSTNKPAP